MFRSITCKFSFLSYFNIHPSFIYYGFWWVFHEIKIITYLKFTFTCSMFFNFLWFTIWKQVNSITTTTTTYVSEKVLNNSWFWPKIKQTKMLVKGLLICFYLCWSGSILQFRQNMIKVSSRSWLLTCSSNITLSLPSYTGSDLKKELKICNGYLSLLYFCSKAKRFYTVITVISR